MPETMPIPKFLQALKAPESLGWPGNPYLRLPILAWISLDPSQEAQQLAHAIWNGLPEDVRAQAKALWKVSL
jgi:hypothetical protein